METPPHTVSSLHANSIRFFCSCNKMLQFAVAVAVAAKTQNSANVDTKFVLQSQTKLRIFYDFVYLRSLGAISARRCVYAALLHSLTHTHSGPRAHTHAHSMHNNLFCLVNNSNEMLFFLVVVFLMLHFFCCIFLLLAICTQSALYKTSAWALFYI